jgi:hypothetical protein
MTAKTTTVRCAMCDVRCAMCACMTFIRFWAITLERSYSRPWVHRCIGLVATACCSNLSPLTVYHIHAGEVSKAPSGAMPVVPKLWRADGTLILKSTVGCLMWYRPMQIPILPSQMLLAVRPTPPKSFTMASHLALLGLCTSLASESKSDCSRRGVLKDLLSLASADSAALNIFASCFNATDVKKMFACHTAAIFSQLDQVSLQGCYSGILHNSLGVRPRNKSVAIIAALLHGCVSPCSSFEGLKRTQATMQIYTDVIMNICFQIPGRGQGPK